MNDSSIQTFSVSLNFLLLPACAGIQEVGPVQRSQVDQLSTGISQQAINTLFDGNLAKQFIQHQYYAADYQVSIYDLVIGTESALDLNGEVIRLCLPKFFMPS